MFRKVLVANRGEIAIRAFRAAYELGAGTVAVFPHEDRNSLHRMKADEAYQIGEAGHPVRAYLSVEEIIKAARKAGADAVYPGYGFLSENPELARACEEAGITFVGPPTEVLQLTGNKARAVAAAREAGLPVLRSSEPSADVDELLAAGEELGFPMFVKAVAGGGGRGMRRVLEDRARCASRSRRPCARPSPRSATRPCSSSRPWSNPRHIEVQILADGEGNVMHLFERDCSVQRRHQKVIEIAPAPNLDPELRDRICADAVALRPAHRLPQRRHRRVPARPQDGQHVFIEMNPRIQVEHTVTEEVTDVDLVQSQLRIAARRDARRPGAARRRTIRTARRRAAVPHHHRGPGQRVPPGHRHDQRLPLAGRRRHPARRRHRRSPAPRSARTSTRCWSSSPAAGHDFPAAVGRARRAVAEFRIRGVATNIPFLQAVLDDPDFLAGRVTTTFIEERPHLLTARHSADRGTRLLTYLADVTVNKPHGERPEIVDPVEKLPARRPGHAARRLQAAARRARARRASRAGCGSRRRSASPTRRSATRTSRCSPPGCAPRTCSPSRRTSRSMMPELLSLECWGGATYDVALRFLAEDPWERLAALRDGGAEHLPADAAARAQHRRLHAVPDRGDRRVRRGGRGHRHRHLPDLRRAQRRRADAPGHRRRAARPARRSPRWRSATPPTCPTRPSGCTHWTTTCKLAEQIVGAGAHVLASRTWPGCCARRPRTGWSPRCARSSTCRCTCTPTTPRAASSPPTSPRSRPGVDAVDGAVASMAGTTSQPSLSALVAATDHSERATGLDLQAVGDLEPYWEVVRKVYAPFEAGLPAPTGRVYTPRDPGRAAVEPAHAGHRARSRRTGSSRSRRPTPPPTGCSAGWSR